MNLKPWVVALFLTAGAWSQQVYVSNRPFKQVEKVGSRLVADLKALAPLLDLRLTQQGDMVLLEPMNQTEATEVPSAPGLYFRGRPLQSGLAGAELKVDLELFLQEIGGRLVKNPGLGTLHVYPPARPVSGASPSNNPLLLVYQRGGISQTAPTLEGTTPLSINLDDEENADTKRYKSYWTGTGLPGLVLLAPSGRVIATWSSLPAVGEIKQKLDAYLATMKQNNLKGVSTPPPAKHHTG